MSSIYFQIFSNNKKPGVATSGFLCVSYALLDAFIIFTLTISISRTDIIFKRLPQREHDGLGFSLRIFVAVANAT